MDVPQPTFAPRRTRHAGIARRTALLAILLAAAPAVAPGAQAIAPRDTLSVMTFNIRYAHTQPPDLWPDRLPVMVDLINRWRPDILGTQEGLYPQLRDLERTLPDYAWIGLGRDGGSRGEFMAVVDRRDRLEPLEYDHYWLSDTPAVMGSHTWGNSLPRMVTWVRFRERTSGRELVFVNTHFDHESQPSRERSAALISERLAGTRADLPLILGGDFYVAAGANPVYSILTGTAGFTDSWRAVGGSDTLGTFHGFKGVAAARGTPRIDWILTRGPVTALSSQIITDARNGQLPSDHFPVIARLRLTSPLPAARPPGSDPSMPRSP
jgi:endonuclease/exonuclease/phosphatase family metal-dependent hydrolase